MTNVAGKAKDENIGHSFEYKWIPIRALNVDDLYQRQIKDMRIKNIVKHWNPDLVNPPKVSLRSDGSMYIFDGQHTAVAYKIHEGDDAQILCKVYRGLTWQEEVELFLAQEGPDKRALTTNERLRAMYNSNDEQVRSMVKAAELAGVRVDFGKSQATNKVTAVSTLFKVYKRISREQYIDMLVVLRNAWDGNPEGFTRELLTGMAEFFKAYYGKFKLKDLEKSLSKVSPIQITREGKSIGTASSTYARIILRIYNNGRSTNRLPDLL